MRQTTVNSFTLVTVLDICAYVSFRSFQGKTPILTINEAEAIKQITIKEFHKFTNRRPFVVDIGSRFLSYSLTVLNDDHWKHLRTILTPTFTSGKLKNVSTAMFIPVVFLLSDACVRMMRIFFSYRCFQL